MNSKSGTIRPKPHTGGCSLVLSLNVGSFPKTDYFRAYSRDSGTGKRTSQGEWYEIVSGERADMHADWYQQVTAKGYLKSLTLSESEHLEWYLDYELKRDASASYKLFKQKYKVCYGQTDTKSKKSKKGKRLRPIRKSPLWKRLPLLRLMMMVWKKEGREREGVIRVSLGTSSPIFVL